VSRTFSANGVWRLYQVNNARLNGNWG
jgi:hypothetical protein